MLCGGPAPVLSRSEGRRTSSTAREVVTVSAALKICRICRASPTASVSGGVVKSESRCGFLRATASPALRLEGAPVILQVLLPAIKRHSPAKGRGSGRGQTGLARAKGHATLFGGKMALAIAGGRRSVFFIDGAILNAVAATGQAIS